MSKLLINENPLVILPTLAQKVGIHEAILLQQIHYWIDPKINRNLKEGKYWVYNSYSQWQEQIKCLSQITIKRTMLSLEKQELVISKNFNSSSFNKTKWYTLNYKKLKELEVGQHRQEGYNSIDTDPKILLSNRSNQIDPSIVSKRSTDKINLIRSNIDTETTTKTINSLYPLSREKESEERDILKNLILVWERKILFSSAQITLNKTREKKLKEVFKNYFESDYMKWQKFVDQISESDFLMGKVTKFRISLDWAITQSNILKILEGNYFNKETLEKIKTIEYKKVSLAKLEEDGVPNPAWKLFLSKLKNRFGEDTYLRWFSKMQFLSQEENLLKIKVPFSHYRDHISSCYGATLRSLANTIFGTEIILFEIEKVI